MQIEALVVPNFIEIMDLIFFGTLPNTTDSTKFWLVSVSTLFEKYFVKDKIHALLTLMGLNPFSSRWGDSHLLNLDSLHYF